jgi:nucleotide-binding universal stress UspA family protein
MFRPKKILVPTDFSEYSDRALLQATDIAKQYNAKVFLFHVVEDYVQQCVVDYCLDYAEVEQLKAEMMAKAKEKIAREIEKLPQAKEVEIIADIGHGKPYEAILNEEQEKGIDLIVLASLGKSGIAHIIIGSVARHILRGAGCAVLLTK